MTESSSDFNGFALRHDAMKIAVTDMSVNRIFSLGCGPSEPPQWNGTTIYATASTCPDLLMIMGGDEAFQTFPVCMQSDETAAQSWQKIRSVRQLVISEQLDEHRRRLFDYETQQFDRHPPTATLFASDTAVSGRSLDLKNPLMMECKVPAHILESLAADILLHKVTEVSLQVSWLWAFVRSVLSTADGDIPLSTQYMETASRAGDRPDQIFGDRRTWGLFPTERESQYGYVNRISWRPESRSVILPAAEPIPQLR